MMFQFKTSKACARTNTQTSTDGNIYAHLNCLSVYETQYFGNMSASRAEWPEKFDKNETTGGLCLFFGDKSQGKVSPVR